MHLFLSSNCYSAWTTAGFDGIFAFVNRSLIDPARMLQRTVAHVAVKNVNCYRDHVFYTDSKNERIWTVPLTGETPYMMRNKAADSLNLFPSKR